MNLTTVFLSVLSHLYYLTINSHHIYFSGLLKGSTTSEGMVGGCRAERPKTLRRLRNVYEQMNSSSDSKRSQDDSGSTGTSTDKTLAILSPFDEQEEWAKISEIMASFGTGLVRESVFVSDLEKEFQARLG